MLLNVHAVCSYCTVKTSQCPHIIAHSQVILRPQLDMCWYFVHDMTTGNGAGFSPIHFSFQLPVIIPPLLSTVMSLPPAVQSNALQVTLLWCYSLHSESECIYFSQYCSNGTKWNVICLVREGRQERYQIALFYLFLASDIYSVIIIFSISLFVHTLCIFYTDILQLMYQLVIIHFDTSVPASECLLCWIHLSGQFVRSDPAVFTDIYILVTGWHSIYRVKWNNIMYQLCFTFLQM
jgi:hypothetical protein